MKNWFKYILSRAAYVILRPVFGKVPAIREVDVYASKMLVSFNWLHNLIFPRFFSKMRIDEDSLEEISQGLDKAIPIYITDYIGQLEYNFFNYLFLDKPLPLAAYTNGITNRLWMPFKLYRKTVMLRLKTRIANRGTLPHAVASGHVERLISEGKSVLVRLKTTRIHDDLFWDIPQEDIVQALITAQRKTDKTLKLIPQQFLWAKRPQKSARSIVDWLFGEREKPGRLRKIVLFWRNYKKDAVVQFGEPLDLKDFLEAHPAIPDEELARILRNSLFSQITEERKRITGPTLKPRRWIYEHVLESENVEKQIVKIATEKNKNIEDVRELARRYIKTIAADVNYTYVEYGTKILQWVFNSMYDGIHFNQEGLAEIKKIAARTPIVFVPNHRSHVDYLLLTTLLYENNVSIPHVAAGENLSFWPLGKIFRSGGAFFLRRTFAGNELYKAVFETYIKLLLEGGYCQEFFIEGGRSRTGKLRQPMMGMLSMYTQAMLEKTAHDVIFVPTSITYDKVVEESVYINESEGKEKKREKLTDLFKLKKHTKHRYGKIYVNFGKPISFRRTSEGITEKTKIVETLAFRIMDSINKGSVVTPSALVAAAFMMEKRRGITTKDLFKNIDLIKSFLEYQHIQLSDTLVSEPHHSIEDSIKKLLANKTVSLHQNFEPVCYELSEENRIILDFQKNAIVHFLLPIAFAAASILALIKEGKGKFSREDLARKVEFLTGLLKMEFASIGGNINRTSINSALSFLISKNILQKEVEEYSVEVPGMPLLRRYKAIIDNFIDSYRVAYFTCTNIPHGSAYDEKQIIKTMFDYGKHLAILGRISHSEAVSKPIFEHSLTLFRHVGLLYEEVLEINGKDRPKYRWNGAHKIAAELQEELELFS